jgi:hypothetical protein
MSAPLFSVSLLRLQQAAWIRLSALFRAVATSCLPFQAMPGPEL